MACVENRRRIDSTGSTWSIPIGEIGLVGRKRNKSRRDSGSRSSTSRANLWYAAASPSFAAFCR